MEENGFWDKFKKLLLEFSFHKLSSQDSNLVKLSFDKNNSEIENKYNIYERFIEKDRKIKVKECNFKLIWKDDMGNYLWVISSYRLSASYK